MENQLLIIAVTAIVSAGGTVIGHHLINKLIKRDCSDCEEISQLKSDIKTIKRVTLTIASKIGADTKDYEELIS